MLHGMPDNLPAAADTRGEQRARAIAAIHAFADHLAEHPELPMPHGVTAVAMLGDAAPGKSAEGLALDWADANGLDASAVYGGESTVMITLPIAGRELHGIEIHYSGHFMRADPARPL